MFARGRKANAFTLIELMIVVAIIGILAAVAIPMAGGLILRAKEADVKAKLGALRSALSVYYSDVQEYPSDPTIALITAQKYIKEIPSYTIPPALDNGNPGHLNTTGAFTTTADDTATGGWYYLSNGTETGSIYVNCRHNDTRGQIWSGY